MNQIKSSHLLVATILTLAAITTALACQVPVFRYALERWQPDAYEILIVGADQLSETEQAVVDFLEKAPIDAEAPANIRLRLASGSTEPNSNSPTATATSEKPHLELYYPRSLREFLPKPFWTGDITMENAHRILHSPTRTQIARNILEGDSATWVFVESGNPEKDNVIAAQLADHANAAKEALRIPDGVIGASEAETATNLSPADAENVLEFDVPLKVDFSILRLSRDDPAEEIFLAMLLNVEDDLGDFASEPITFASFGRGRILQPLVGAGVTADNVMFDSSYLCGACSCQVKEENPGIDLLLAAPWDEALKGSGVIVDKILPPLEGVASLIANGTPIKVAEYETHDPVEGTTADIGTSPLVSLAVLIAMAAVAILTFTNVRERLAEIGILRAIGVTGRTILATFLGRATAAGLSGALLGILIALAAGPLLGQRLFHGATPASLIQGGEWLLILVAAPILTCLASWLPAFDASQRDPADVLRHD